MVFNTDLQRISSTSLKVVVVTFPKDLTQVVRELRAAVVNRPSETDSGRADTQQRRCLADTQVTRITDGPAPASRQK